MSVKEVVTDKAPKPIGPYSQAVQVGSLVFTSGQIPLDPATGELVKGTIEQETEQVFANLDAVLRAARTSLAKAVKVTVYLTDLGDFTKVNDIYGRKFGRPFPARTTVQVSALPKGCRVEIDVVAEL
jgi:2-iminobutanoate/2-iminopropanoate deaminase